TRSPTRSKLRTLGSETWIGASTVPAGAWSASPGPSSIDSVIGTPAGIVTIGVSPAGSAAIPAGVAGSIVVLTSLARIGSPAGSSVAATSTGSPVGAGRNSLTTARAASVTRAVASTNRYRHR